MEQIHILTKTEQAIDILSRVIKCLKSDSSIDHPECVDELRDAIDRLEGRE